MYPKPIDMYFISNVALNAGIYNNNGGSFDVIRIIIMNVLSVISERNIRKNDDVIDDKNPVFI